MADEIVKCEARGVPIDGVCLYPIIDRPDWENPSHWHKSGLWDVENTGENKVENTVQNTDELTVQASIAANSDLQTTELANGTNPNLEIENPVLNLAKPHSYNRVLNQPYANSLRYWQTRFSQSPLSDLTFNKLINGDLPMQTLLVFSHLRWNFVFQRPQHLLSRLADHYKILFVEEPINSAHDDYL